MRRLFLEERKLFLSCSALIQSKPVWQENVQAYLCSKSLMPSCVIHSYSSKYCGSQNYKILCITPVFTKWSFSSMELNIRRSIFCILHFLFMMTLYNLSLPSFQTSDEKTQIKGWFPDFCSFLFLFSLVNYPPCWSRVCICQVWLPPRVSCYATFDQIKEFFSSRSFFSPKLIYLVSF